MHNGIPSDWKGYLVKQVYRICELYIQVSNPGGVQHGVKQLPISRKAIDGIIMPEMANDKASAAAAVTLG